MRKKSRDGGRRGEPRDARRGVDDGLLERDRLPPRVHLHDPRSDDQVVPQRGGAGEPRRGRAHQRRGDDIAILVTRATVAAAFRAAAQRGDDLSAARPEQSLLAPSGEELEVVGVVHHLVRVRVLDVDTTGRLVRGQLDRGLGDGRLRGRPRLGPPGGGSRPRSARPGRGGPPARAGRRPRERRGRARERRHHRARPNNG